MNTEKKPQASIIVPVHNAQERIGALVACLKAQTCPDFEVILVNDGSTDDTQALLAHLVEGDPRFRLLYQANAGPGAARNTGLAAARGDYVLFADSDDSLKPVLVERVLATVHGRTDDESCAETSEGARDSARQATGPAPDIVCYQFNFLDERTGEVFDNEESWNPQDYPPVFCPADYPGMLFEDFRNWPWNKAFRLEYLRSRAIRFPGLHRSEDLAFTCSALAAATSIALLDECLYTYRVGGQDNSTSTRDAWASDYYASACALHDYLSDNDLMSTFGRTYRQWVGLGAFLNLVELKTDDGFEEAYRLLADGGLARIGIDPAAYEGTDAPSAGRYTTLHAKSVLEAIASGGLSDARAAADAVHYGFACEDRMKLYVSEYGSFLGPLLCRATQGIHDRKHARA